jgi:hypothetical protein
MVAFFEQLTGVRPAKARRGAAAPSTPENLSISETVMARPGAGARMALVRIAQNKPRGAISNMASERFLAVLQTLIRLEHQRDWSPDLGDYRDTLRMLRDQGSEICFNAALGFVAHWNGNGSPKVRAIAADVKAFADRGFENRRALRQIIAKARATWRSSMPFDYRDATEIPEAELISTLIANKLYPANVITPAWIIVLEMDDSANWPDPKARCIGERPAEMQDDGEKIFGMDLITPAVTKALGKRHLDPRWAREYMNKAGIVRGREGTRVFVYREDLKRLAGPSDKPDDASDKRPKPTKGRERF